ncbi:MAG: FixH family protein [Dehalococcoidia bacterium]|nr:FixH family protein [Dehalococcoidia bacterium]
MARSLPAAGPRLLLRGMALLVTVALALAGARPALAHAELVDSNPAANAVLPVAPERITLTFSETVDPKFTQALALDAQRQRVDAGDVRISGDRLSLSLGLKTPLPDGTYLVNWRVLSSVDGHVTAGSFPFTIGGATQGAELGAAGPASSAYIVSPLEVMGRFLHLVGAVVATGSGIFVLLVAPAAFRGKRGRNARLADVKSRTFSFLRLLLWGSIAALALAAVAALVDQALKLETSPLRVVTETRLGAFWLTRVALILGLVAAVARPWPRPSEGTRPRVMLLVVTSLGALLLLTTSLTSHAAALSGPTALYVLADWLHMLAASAWVGGLVFLVRLLAVAPASLTASEHAEVLGGVITRFHVLALASVGVLIGTGILSSLIQVGSFPGLLTTGYGNVLLVKLALLVPMLALAATNALWARPRIMAAAHARLAATATTLVRRFRLLVRGEAVMGVLIVAVAALLVTMPPAAGEIAARASVQKLQLVRSADDLRITLAISPGRPGVNTFEVALNDVRGAPLTTPAQVTLNFTSEAGDVGASTLDLQSVRPGVYRAAGGNLVSRGRWSVEMFVRRADALDARTVFPVDVAETLPASAFAAPAAPAPPLVELRAGGVAFSGMWVPGLGVIIGLVMMGCLGLVFWSLRRLRLRPAWTILAGLVLVAMAAASWANAFARDVQSITSSPALLAPGGNPVASTPASVAIGQRLYQANCAQCHGVTGRSDGPEAPGLALRPADLQLHVPLHSDSQLFYFISEGLFGTPMLPFKDKLSDEERWHLVNYLRSMTTEASR